MKLVAVYPILYRARQYEVGDELPDSEMKQTWLDAGTATLVEDEPEAPAPRAQMLQLSQDRSESAIVATKMTSLEESQRASKEPLIR